MYKNVMHQHNLVVIYNMTMLATMPKWGNIYNEYQLSLDSVFINLTIDIQGKSISALLFPYNVELGPITCMYNSE